MNIWKFKMTLAVAVMLAEEILKNDTSHEPAHNEADREGKQAVD